MWYKKCCTLSTNNEKFRHGNSQHDLLACINHGSLSYNHSLLTTPLATVRMAEVWVLSFILVPTYIVHHFRLNWFGISVQNGKLTNILENLLIESVPIRPDYMCKESWAFPSESCFQILYRSSLGSCLYPSWVYWVIHFLNNSVFNLKKF